MRSSTDRRDQRVRVGAVSYLNSKPLIEGLAESVPEARLTLDFPSRLADGLARGTLDVALVPSIEALTDPDYEIISDACVAACGPVLSVKLYFRKAPGDVKSLALDEGSRTSAALARVMLAERFGVEPRIEKFTLESRIEDTSADAVLMIGDRAMLPPEIPFVEEWDLGEEWLRWTGLPFVFALWVGRQGSDLGKVDMALAAARDLGVASIPRIAERESALMGLPLAVVDTYLRRHLHFTMGSAERQGLKLYHSLASKLGLAPANRTVRFCERSVERRASRRPATVNA
ncbi:menaquinone biosynthetic enzyme MqnA/MqnD family protein [Caulifigura coniformis]|nr:menaquinone biosynthesis protein [Caulifigura coniformis]